LNNTKQHNTNEYAEHVSLSVDIFETKPIFEDLSAADPLLSKCLPRQDSERKRGYQFHHVETLSEKHFCQQKYNANWCK